MKSSSTEYGLVSNDQFVGKLVQKYLFPSICALLGIQASGFVNSMIIGRIFGEGGLGVVSLVAPVSLVYYSIGSLVGVGASIVSSIALGKGDKEQCRQVYTQAYLVMLGAGTLITAMGLLCLDRIVILLGAKGDYYLYTYEYVRNYILGGVGIMLMYIPLNYLRIAGKPRLAMLMLILMSVFHVAGLFFFVVFLGLGIGGTALASVVSGILTFLAGLGMLRDKNSVLRFRRPRSPGRQLIALVSAGSPSALNNICQAAQIFFINLLFIRMGIGVFLPGYSLVFTVSELVLAVILGVSQMTLPLVGISFGEGDFRSIRLVMKKAMGTGNAIVGGCVILLLVLQQKLGRLFGLTDPLVLRQTGIGLVFLSFSLNLALINSVIMSFFSATRQTAVANAIVVFRMVLFMVIPAYALFPLANVYSVWISLILTELLTLGAVYLIVTVKHAKNPGLSRYLLLDESLMENSKVIDFSVKNTPDAVVFASDKISGFCEENGVPPKKTMRISLAIEEMIVMINQNSIKGDTAYTDVRIMIIGERIVMRIRNLGKYFNPVEYYYENKDTEEGREKTLGIAMILKLAQETEYQETFGVNNLLITI